MDHAFTQLEGTAWGLWRGQWERNIGGRNVSDETKTAYLRSLDRLIEWARDNDHHDPEELKDEDLDTYFDFLAHHYVARFGGKEGRVRTGSRERLSPTTRAIDYRHLKVFFNFMSERADIKNQFAKVKAPIVPKQDPEIPEDDAIRAMLATCKSKSFADLRDKAIIRMLSDTGHRRTELGTIWLGPRDDGVADVDLRQQKVRVHGKGRKSRWTTYGAKTADALDTYLIARRKHPDANLPELWLATHPYHRGALKPDGIKQMLKRRAGMAGIPGRVFLHLIRHWAVHKRKKSGQMSDEDLQHYFGWESPAMLNVYGRTLAKERAIESSRKTSPADSL
jgi:site-specific recombinase XerD